MNGRDSFGTHKLTGWKKKRTSDDDDAPTPFRPSLLMKIK